MGAHRHPLLPSRYPFPRHLVVDVSRKSRRDCAIEAMVARRHIRRENYHEALVEMKAQQLH